MPIDVSQAGSRPETPETACDTAAPGSPAGVKEAEGRRPQEGDLADAAAKGGVEEVAGAQAAVVRDADAHASGADAPPGEPAQLATHHANGLVDQTSYMCVLNLVFRFRDRSPSNICALQARQGDTSPFGPATYVSLMASCFRSKSSLSCFQCNSRSSCPSWSKQSCRASLPLCGSLLHPTLMLRLLRTALPTISAAFDAGRSSAFVPAMYLLTSTALQPVWGRLSDIFGRKYTLLACMSIFIIGSLGCAVAQTMLQLIVLRGLQGAGGGGLLTLVLIVSSHRCSSGPSLNSLPFRLCPTSFRSKTAGSGRVLPRRRFSSGASDPLDSPATGSLTRSSCSNAIGPLVGGAIAQHTTWRWVFWLSALLVLRPASSSPSLTLNCGRPPWRRSRHSRHGLLPAAQGGKGRCQAEAPSNRLWRRALDLLCHRTCHPALELGRYIVRLGVRPRARLPPLRLGPLRCLHSVRMEGGQDPGRPSCGPIPQARVLLSSTDAPWLQRSSSRTSPSRPSSSPPSSTVPASSRRSTICLNISKSRAATARRSLARSSYRNSPRRPSSSSSRVSSSRGWASTKCAPTPR